MVDSGGVTRFAKKVWLIDDSGIARLVFSPVIVAAASPANVSAHTLNPAQITTPVTTVAVTSGGIAPFTFRWSFASGGAGITITSPNTQSTAFTAFVSSGDDFEGDAICTVTDSVGTVGVSNGVFVILNSTA
jgi:hypothetical protein